MSEPRENHGAPLDAEDSTPEAEGSWRNVPRPSTEELLTPSTQVVDAPSIPLLVKIVGILLVIVLLGLSVWLGLSLGTSGESDPAPTPSVDESLWEMEAPTQLGSLVRGEVTSRTQGDRDLETATYSDGTDKVVLSLSRPESDLTSYLKGANVSKAEPVEGTKGISCGVSKDTDFRFCARIVDDTGIGVLGVSEQDIPTLTALVDDFYEEMQ